MLKDFFWSIFIKSGNIETYLAYCDFNNRFNNKNSERLNLAVTGDDINSINKIASFC